MVIESNIPLKTATRGRRIYPWIELLSANESFFVPDVPIGRVSSAATKASRRLQIRLACRTVTEHGRDGVRVWRVA